MDIVLTGGRDYDDAENTKKILRAVGPAATRFLVGDCPTGLDFIAREWLLETGIEHQIFSADWKTHGRAAGPLRNRAMCNAAAPGAILVAFPGGRGTNDCVYAAKLKGIPVLRLEE